MTKTGFNFEGYTVYQDRLISTSRIFEAMAVPTDVMTCHRVRCDCNVGFCLLYQYYCHIYIEVISFSFINFIRIIMYLYSRNKGNEILFGP